MNRYRFTQIINHAILILLAFLTLYPLFLMFISSFKWDMLLLDNFWFVAFPLHVENYAKAFRQTIPFMINSMIVTVGVSLLSLTVSTMAGYSFSRFDFPGRNFLFYIMLMLMMVPGFMTLIPQFMIARDLKLLNTYIVQILPLTGAISVLSTFLVRTFVDGLPQSLFDMAYIEGAGDGRVLLSIVIPLCKPVLSVIAIMNTIAAWNNYIWPLVAANQAKVRPVIIQITNIIGQDYELYGLRFAAYTIAAVPLLVLYMLTTRAFVSGLTEGSIKA